MTLQDRKMDSISFLTVNSLCVSVCLICQPLSLIKCRPALVLSVQDRCSGNERV